MPPPDSLKFSAALSQPQPGSDAALALGWTWPEARAACDAHKRGDFALSWQLWTDVDSLPAIRAAKARRLASPCGLPWEVDGPSRAPGRYETEAARFLWKGSLRRLLRSTLSDVVGMGFSVWQHPTAVNPISLRREVVTVERWPLSQVRYAPTPFPDVWQPGKLIHKYYAIQYGVGPTVGAAMFGPWDPAVQRIAGELASGISQADAKLLFDSAGVWVRFIQLPPPGQTDGHWTLVADPVGADQPHLNGAITALDVGYVGGTIMTRSMYNLAKTLGRQSPTYEMPPGVETSSQEGKAAAAVLAQLGTTNAAGVFPGGGHLSAFSLTAQNADTFPAFAALNLRDVELAILGRAGTIVKEDAQYEAKDGLTVTVPEDLVRADVAVIVASAEALFNVLAQSNTPDVPPIRLESHLPDTEQDARRLARQTLEKGEAEKLQGFWKAVDAERAQGFEFTPTPEGQARLDFLAARCGVVAPKIPKGGLPPVLVKLPRPTVPITGEDAQPLPAPANPPDPPGAPTKIASPPPAA